MGLIITIVILAALFFIIKAAVKNTDENENSTSNQQNCTTNKQSTITPRSDERLPKPGNDYAYYELVGMKYRNLTANDLGIHSGYAFAEDDNEYDKYAVGIYRTDNNKLVAYIPKEFQGRSNRELHRKITKLGGSTPAEFRIWERNGNIYGCAYIKEE